MTQYAKKRLIGTGVLFITLLILVNLSFLRYFLPQTYPHTYCSDQGRFCTIEKAKGHDTIGSVEIVFNRYKEKTNQPNLILHRRFYRKWWQIWNWYDFFTERCWDFPYAERDEDT